MLWIFGLAFGLTEAATVVYLRATAQPPIGSGLFPLSVLSPQLISIEIVREACTMAMLAAVALLKADWAPAIITVFFVLAGSYLMRTKDEPHEYRVNDWVVFLGATLAVLVAFLLDADAVHTSFDQPQFPQVLYWAGVLAGVGSFVHAELRRPQSTGSNIPRRGG